MKIIFFGLGSIGTRQAKIIKEKYDYELIAFRSDKNKPCNSLGIKEVFSWAEVEIIKPHIAFVTNPTDCHIKTALRCAKLGMHLFIEKPLSNNLKGIQTLEGVCRRNKLVCYTAYCLRFHPVLNKVKKLLSGKEIYHVRVVCTSFLPGWRKNQDHLKHYSAFSRKGGGVTLELSHEFDYIQYLFGEIIGLKGQKQRVAENITVDADDIADILIRTKQKINVNLHLNFLSHYNERSIKVDFADGYLHADLFTNKIEYFYRGKLAEENITLKPNEYYIRQLDYFFSNLKNKKIMNNLAESKQLLHKILEIALE